MTAAEREAERQRLEEWLRDVAGARHGFAREIANLANGTRAGIRNSTPPAHLWHRIVPTLRLVESVRERFGGTTITSAYRDLAYNTVIRGSIGSRHMQFDALDFLCATGTPREWADFLRQKRTAGEFRGGIGVYVTSGFCHVDTRGINVDF
jgi:uncharacterized protein YcbK (DUF882 family)